jgi:hypothetical protein
MAISKELHNTNVAKIAFRHDDDVVTLASTTLGLEDEKMLL